MRMAVNSHLSLPIPRVCGDDSSVTVEQGKDVFKFFSINEKNCSLTIRFALLVLSLWKPEAAVWETRDTSNGSNASP